MWPFRNNILTSSFRTYWHLHAPLSPPSMFAQADCNSHGLLKPCSFANNNTKNFFCRKKCLQSIPSKIKFNMRKLSRITTLTGVTPPVKLTFWRVFAWQQWYLSCICFCSLHKKWHKGRDKTVHLSFSHRYTYIHREHVLIHNSWQIVATPLI